MTDTDTKHRILDAAENLFADKGFEATSLRAITTEAGVNLAAVHYHFGSKEALIQAVTARRVDPVNRERLAALEALEKAHPEGVLPLEGILRAFLRPTLQLRRASDHEQHCIRQLLGRHIVSSDERIETLLIEAFADVGRRFLGAFHRALPHLSRADLAWRFLFLLGMMAFTLSDRRKLTFISGGAADSSDLDAALEQMVAFAAGGFRSPVPGSSPSNGGVDA